MKNSSIYTILAILTINLMISCTTKNAPDNIMSYSSPSDDYLNLKDSDIVKLNPDFEKEFTTIYSLLRNFSIYQDRLADANSYNNLGQAIGAIKDRFTVYYNPKNAYQLLQSLTTPEIRGILGFRFRYVQKIDSLRLDTIIISDVFNESNAQKLGVKKEDRLLEINGKSLIGIGYSVFDSLNLWKGTGALTDQIQFKFLRKDSVYTVEIQPSNIPIPTIFIDSVAPQISKIWMTQFSSSTLKDPDQEKQIKGQIYGTWKEVLAALDSTKNDKVTLFDLRGNGGGSIDQCQGISDEFIDNGEMFKIIDRTDKNPIQKILATPGGKALGRDFVFLSDRNSASCAEILLTAVRENRKFLIVGDTTYGKGIGQSFHYGYLTSIINKSLYPSLVKITSLEIRTKNDISYQDIGLFPDFLIPQGNPQDSTYSIQSELQLRKAIEVAQLRVNPVLARKSSFAQSVQAPIYIQENEHLNSTLQHEFYRLPQK